MDGPTKTINRATDESDRPMDRPTENDQHIEVTHACDRPEGAEALHGEEDTRHDVHAAQIAARVRRVGVPATKPKGPCATQKSQVQSAGRPCIARAQSLKATPLRRTVRCKATPLWPAVQRKAPPLWTAVRWIATTLWRGERERRRTRSSPGPKKQKQKNE